MVLPVVTHCRSSVTLVKYRHCRYNIGIPTVQRQVLHCREHWVQQEILRTLQSGLNINCLMKYSLIVLLVNDLAGKYLLPSQLYTHFHKEQGIITICTNCPSTGKLKHHHLEIYISRRFPPNHDSVLSSTNRNPFLNVIVDDVGI